LLLRARDPEKVNYKGILTFLSGGGKKGGVDRSVDQENEAKKKKEAAGISIQGGGKNAATSSNAPIEGKERGKQLLGR